MNKNKKQGMATVWLIVMIAILKLFSIIFLCSLHIDLEKVLAHKYQKQLATSPIIFLKN